MEVDTKEEKPETKETEEKDKESSKNENDSNDEKKTNGVEPKKEGEEIFDQISNCDLFVVSKFTILMFSILVKITMYHHKKHNHIKDFHLILAF